MNDFVTTLVRGTPSRTAIDRYIKNADLAKFVVMNTNLTIQELVYLWKQVRPDLDTALTVVRTHPDPAAAATVVKLDKRPSVCVAAVQTHGLTPELVTVIETTPALIKSSLVEKLLVEYHLEHVPVSLTDFWAVNNKVLPQHVWYYQREGSKLSLANAVEAAATLDTKNKSSFKARNHVLLATNFDANLLECLAAKQLFLTTLAGVSSLDVNPIVVDAIIGQSSAIDTLAVKHNVKPGVCSDNYFALVALMYNPFTPPDTCSKIETCVNNTTGFTSGDLVELKEHLVRASSRSVAVQDSQVCEQVVRKRSFSKVRLFELLKMFTRFPDALTEHDYDYFFTEIECSDWGYLADPHQTVTKFLSLLDTAVPPRPAVVAPFVQPFPASCAVISSSLMHSHIAHTSFIHLTDVNHPCWLWLADQVDDNESLWDLLPVLAQTFHVNLAGVVSSSASLCECGAPLNESSLVALLERAKLLLN